MSLASSTKRKKNKYAPQKLKIIKLRVQRVNNNTLKIFPSNGAQRE